MKAVVFHEFGSTDVLRVEELPDPVPGAGQVVVDITATALNHLDVDVREGISRFPVTFPHTAGVEPVGRIAAIGDGVVGWAIGDRVGVYLIATCGSCVYCLTGRSRFAPHRTGSSAWGRAVRTPRRLPARPRS